MSALRIFNKTAVALAQGIAIALAALITLFVFVSIVSRNFLSYSFEYAVEGNQLLFMWMCFMGIVAVHSSDMMLKFEMLEQRITGSARRPWHLILHVCTLAVAVIMAVAGWEMLSFAEGQRFSTMPVSYFWLYLPVPIAGVLIFTGTIEKMHDVLTGKTAAAQA